MHRLFSAVVTAGNRLVGAARRYGPVKKLRIVNDKESGKPSGYAFVGEKNAAFCPTKEMACSAD